MKVIRLNGELGKRFGRVHKLDVRTPAEAVRALCVNFEGFEQFVRSSHERGVAYRCIVDSDKMDEAHIHYPMSKSFSITPVVHGGGKVLGIILGAVLIVAAIALAPEFVAATATAAASGGMAAGIGFLGLTYANVAWLGVALVLGGISQLLAPTPKAPAAADKNENAYFNGAANTTAQGGAVPLGYGRAVVGSAVISAAITVEQNPTYTAGYDYMMPGYNIP